MLCVRRSRDENCLLAGMLGSRLALLDRSSGEVLAEYRGHVNEGAKVDSCLTRGDAHVASGSEDGRVYFWVGGTSRLSTHTRTQSSINFKHLNAVFF